MVGTVAARSLLSATLGVGITLAIGALVDKPVPFAVYAILILAFTVRLILVTTEWWTTRYEIHNVELEYRSGRLNSTSLHIPWSSVRGMHVEAPWLLRLWRRSEVRIMHGAGRASEIHLKALSASKVAELRTSIESGRGEGLESSQETSEFRYAKTSLYCFAHAQWYFIFPLLVAILGLLSRLLQKDLLQTSTYVWERLVAMQTSVIVLSTLGVLCVALTIGYISKSAQMAKFRVRHTSDLIETRQGLISTRTRTIKTSDVTVVEVQRPLVFRMMRRSIVLVSGGSGDGQTPYFLSLDSTRRETSALVRSVFSDYRRTKNLGASSPVGLIMVSMPWIAVAVLSHALFRNAWTLSAVFITGALVVLWAVRIRSRFLLGPQDLIEIQLGLKVHKRLIFRASSILHYESVTSVFGRWTPTNRVRLTIADRGVREISIRGLSGIDLREIHRTLAQLPHVGSYQYARALDTQLDEG